MKLIGGAGVLLFAGFLVLLFGHAKLNEGRLDERAGWLKIVQQRDAEIARLNLGNANARADAAEAYADKLAGMQPVVLRSVNTVEKFAQTPAGAVACLNASRLLGLQSYSTALGLGSVTATPAPSNGPVPGNAVGN